MSKAPRKQRHGFRRVDGFLRDFTEGFRPRDLARLFDRDAPDAFTLLAREHAEGPEPEDGLRRAIHRARLVFLGVAYRLSPARRLIFVVSLVSALFGLIDFGFAYDFGGRVVFDSSPLWFVFSVAGLVLLLGLELVDQLRVRDELEVARQLQAQLLPRTTPDLPGYRITHAYRTANAVGGDYYDFQLLLDGRLALMVGDASGHGMAAGLLMAIANATLKLAIDLDPSPQAVLAMLNRSLVRISGRRSFMSLFYGLLEPDTGRLVYACAGHPYPLLRRAGGEVVEELGEGGLPLGLRASIDIRAGETVLGRDDLLVLYSDGLPEAANEDDLAFGYPRLEKIVRDVQSPEAARDAILAALDRHLGHRPLADDFSLVVIGRTITPPPPPG
ncbi:MAG TPA: PP2C family protein-serine/threonine phosphatase [Thermoanaerobaculia bacterium]|nr:PP2C family protein-serine/threonine phosphatase [Thermoanaerobaculia bacterium]